MYTYKSTRSYHTFSLITVFFNLIVGTISVTSIPLSKKYSTTVLILQIEYYLYSTIYIFLSLKAIVF